MVQAQHPLFGGGSSAGNSLALRLPTPGRGASPPSAAVVLANGDSGTCKHPNVAHVQALVELYNEDALARCNMKAIEDLQVLHCRGKLAWEQSNQAGLTPSSKHLQHRRRELPGQKVLSRRHSLLTRRFQILGRAHCLLVWELHLDW